MDSVLPALLRVTTAVMELGQRVAAGELAARAEVEALDRLLAEDRDRREHRDDGRDEHQQHEQHEDEHRQLLSDHHSRQRQRHRGHAHTEQSRPRR